MTVTAGVEAARKTLAELDADQVSAIKVFDSLDRAVFYEHLTDYIRQIGMQLPGIWPILETNTTPWIDTLRQQLGKVVPMASEPDYEHIDRMITATMGMITQVLTLASEKYPDLAIDDCILDCSEGLQSLRYVMIERRESARLQFDQAKESVRDVMIDAGIGKVDIEEAKAALDGITSRCAAKVMFHGRA